MEIINWATKEGITIKISRQDAEQLILALERAIKTGIGYAYKMHYNPKVDIEIDEES